MSERNEVYLFSFFTLYVLRRIFEMIDKVLALSMSEQNEVYVFIFYMYILRRMFEMICPFDKFNSWANNKKIIYYLGPCQKRNYWDLNFGLSYLITTVAYQIYKNVQCTLTFLISVQHILFFTCLFRTSMFIILEKPATYTVFM